MGCGLRRASALPVSVFIELHPFVCHVNLSQNNLSYESGECLLEGLRKRATVQWGETRRQAVGGRSSLGGRSSPSAGNRRKIGVQSTSGEVTVNLGGTALAWDRTTGPPPGSLLSGRAGTTAPPHERLRQELEETHGVVIAGSRSPSPDVPSPRVSARQQPPQRGGAAAAAPPSRSRPAEQQRLPPGPGGGGSARPGAGQQPNSNKLTGRGQPSLPPSPRGGGGRIYATARRGPGGLL